MDDRIDDDGARLSQFNVDSPRGLLRRFEITLPTDCAAEPVEATGREAHLETVVTVLAFVSGWADQARRTAPTRVQAAMIPSNTQLGALAAMLVSSLAGSDDAAAAFLSKLRDREERNHRARTGAAVTEDPKP